MKIDIWSDVVCPFCYLGKRHLELALADFEHREQVQIEWHSYQLDPDAPAVDPEPVAEMISRKYGISREEAEANNSRLEAQARNVGLEYHLGAARRGNTLAAHRLIHLGAELGHADEVVERFMRGYFTEGQPIGDPDALTALAIEAGLPAERVSDVLASQEYQDAVAADAARAQAYGVRGVPFFVFDETFAVSGAQPVEVFMQALTKAWSERPD